LLDYFAALDFNESIDAIILTITLRRRASADDAISLSKHYGTAATIFLHSPSPLAALQLLRDYCVAAAAHGLARFVLCFAGLHAYRNDENLYLPKFSLIYSYLHFVIFFRIFPAPLLTT
jgi:hypothetical protein